MSFKYLMIGHKSYGYGEPQQFNIENVDFREK